MAAAVPPSAHTECERMTCTFDTMAISAVPGGAQAGESGPQDHDVMGCLLHGLLLRAGL